jgi:hypothetical protein
LLFEAKNKIMKAAAQQAQQPLKGVVKQQCRKPIRAHLATSTRQQASIAGLVHTGMTDEPLTDGQQ